MNKTSDSGSTLGPLLNTEHIVNVEKLIVGGDGLARIKYQDKYLVVFLKMAVPNEKVKIKITQIEKNHLIANILEVVESSPMRRKAPCPYFQKCGGCSWQHILEVEQRIQKEQILTDLFKKFIPQVEYKLAPTIASEKSFGYRNRIQLKQIGSQLGYFEKESHQIVDISSCLIASDEISNQIPKIKAQLKPSDTIKKFELRISQLHEFEYYPIGNKGEELSFSQVNNDVNSELVSTVTKLVEQLRPNFITELYAGAGNFTFPIMSTLPLTTVESVELNSRLTIHTTQKLTELKLQKRLFAFTTDCESFVKRRTLSKELVLLDPPRAGCSEDVLNKIIYTKPENIIYVSCHPAFLVRDIKKIISTDNEYKVVFLQIFDMFPQTDHFETLILLSKQSSK